MATYVLVHGGGHGGWCYKKVTQRLEALGHEVFAPSLTGLAERAHLLSPSVDLDLHINDVVQLLHYWDLRDVTLLTRDPDLIGAARAAGRLWQIDTGHDLMITEPDFVTALVQIAAA